MLPKCDVKVVVCLRKFPNIGEVKEFFDWLTPFRFKYNHKIHMEDHHLWRINFQHVHNPERTTLIGFDSAKTAVAFKLAYAERVVHVYEMP